MIQDISPLKLNNQYRPYRPQNQDLIFYFKGTSVLACKCGDEVGYPDYKTFAEYADREFTYVYALSVDTFRYFIAMENKVESGDFIGENATSSVDSEYRSFIPDYEFLGVNSFRTAKPKYQAFAAITAFHIYGWYRDNKICGRCGKPLIHSTKERMVHCEHCGNIIYPRINPCVIVGVTAGDKILLTKYSGRAYKNYALVAGFTEIGETFEECVRREVMEEVGIRVKNITYYKSQPWALSGSILAGYFCELDGDGTISLEEDELSFGKWISADEIDYDDNGVSLTGEMIMKFKKDHMN